MEPYQSKWVDDTNREFDLTKGPNLKPLSQAKDFKIDSDEDVRGWDVLGSDGGKIGEVDDLVVDERQNAVRYLDIEAEADLGREGVARHMLIPIGAAKMHDDDKKIIIGGISREALEKCPPYTGCPITRDFENQLQASIGNHLDPGTANPSPGTDFNNDDFYKHPIFNKANFYRAGKG